jgi:hypothetical protein
MKCANCDQRFGYGDEVFAEPSAVTKPENIHVTQQMVSQRWSILCLCGHFTILEPG